MAAPYVIPELRERRRNEMRDVLLSHAERLLDEGESFSEMGVDRLVAEAGVGRSTFYKYFADSSDLLGAWYDAIAQDTASAAEQWLDGIGGDASPAKLRAAFDVIFAAYLPHVRLLSVIHEAAYYDESLGAAIRERVERGSGRLAAHIERGQSEGWIDPDLDPAETARWLRWMVDRGRSQLWLDAGETEADRLLDALTGITWSTLYEFAPSRRRA